MISIYVMYMIHTHKHTILPSLSLTLSLKQTAKLVETGTFEEDEEVVFDDMVDEYDDEDEAIDAVRTKN